MELLVCACLVGLLFLSSFSVAQSPEDSVARARALDAMLQEAAFRAFARPRTGVVFDGAVPGAVAGVAVSAVRLRSGSLRRKGFRGLGVLDVPTGVVVQPFVERVVLVYHDLGNWSASYYPLPGYTYLAPVLGLLPYDAANLSAVGLPELDIVATGSPILIRFGNVGLVPGGLVAQCVWFNLDGVPQFRDLASDNVCTTFRRGHFSIVVNGSIPAPPVPAPGLPPLPSHGAKTSSRVWKIVVGAIGGVLALVLLALLVACLVRYRRNRKLHEMEQHAEAGETLRMAPVGRTQAPVASGTRTQPVIETEYVA